MPKEAFGGAGAHGRPERDEAQLRGEGARLQEADLQLRDASKLPEMVW